MLLLELREGSELLEPELRRSPLLEEDLCLERLEEEDLEEEEEDREKDETERRCPRRFPLLLSADSSDLAVRRLL